MKKPLLLLTVVCSACSSSNNKSVVYESTSLEGCADVGGGITGGKVGNAFKSVFGGTSMIVCKNFDIVDEPILIDKNKKQ